MTARKSLGSTSLFMWLIVLLGVFSATRGWEFQIGDNHFDLSKLELSA